MSTDEAHQRDKRRFGNKHDKRSRFKPWEGEGRETLRHSSHERHTVVANRKYVAREHRTANDDESGGKYIRQPARKKEEHRGTRSDYERREGERGKHAEDARYCLKSEVMLCRCDTEKRRYLRDDNNYGGGGRETEHHRVRHELEYEAEAEESHEQIYEPHEKGESRRKSDV